MEQLFVEFDDGWGPNLSQFLNFYFDRKIRVPFIHEINDHSNICTIIFRKIPLGIKFMRSDKPAKLWIKFTKLRCAN